MRLGTYYRYLVSQHLPLPLPKGRVLDVGCYDGFVLSRISAEEKVGIDLKVVEKYTHIRYIQGDFLTYDFGVTKFNTIYAFDVLEHVEDGIQFMQKIISLLSPQGKAILSVPSSTITIFPSAAQKWVDKRWGHLYRRGYNPSEICKLIADTGLDTYRIEDIFLWNGLLFRFFYLALSGIWRLCFPLSKRIVQRIVQREIKMKDGEDGFVFVVITKTS